MAAAPIREATTYLKSADRPAARFLDRRGRIWWTDTYAMVRDELVDRARLDTSLPPYESSARVLRKAVAAEGVPVPEWLPAGSWRDAKGAPGDRVVAYKNPWSSGRRVPVVFADERIAVLHRAACHVWSGEWQWWAVDDRSPLVLRRRRDRMAAAVVSPVRVSGREIAKALEASS